MNISTSMSSPSKGRTGSTRLASLAGRTTTKLGMPATLSMGDLGVDAGWAYQKGTKLNTSLIAIAAVVVRGDTLSGGPTCISRDFCPGLFD